MLRWIVPVSIAWAALLVGNFVQAETNWPRWRGPEQNGHSSDSNLPQKWTEADIAWKTKLPGSGQSSPIIWGDRIFLTAYLEQGAERIVFCVDRKKGDILWQQSAWKGEPEKVHVMNGWASATCVTDGEVVIAFFGRGGGLHAYNVDGKPLWSKDLGRFESPWGVSACPILVDDMVVQNCDADVDAYITALDKRTGKEIWKTKRRDHRGWSTPILVQAGERRELVVNGHEGTQAYDPATGRDLWFCKGFNGRGEPTVTPAGDLLCVVNGLAGDFYSVRPGGEGDVTATHMAWHTPRKGGRDCPSPIVVGNFIIVCDMAGIATCYDAVDGHIYWKERLTGKFSGSPIAAKGLVYFVNEAGKTIVIEPGPALKIVAESDLPAGPDEIFRASPTPCDGQLFIRSTGVLYCLGKK
ncbi:MAG: PQQ-binding-like beta-propeller repeat protein [Pirellulaceae bacterium]|nr:PQQ-binding-like beta-propeller repeat protein [Pirellulaceae bacterium]